MTNHNESNEDRSSLIIRYLGIMGEMTEEERSDFEQKLESDEDLKAELLLTNDMLELANRDEQEEETEEEPLALKTELGKQVYAVLSGWDWTKDEPMDETGSLSEEDVLSKDVDYNEVEIVDTTGTNEIPFEEDLPQCRACIVAGLMHPICQEQDSTATSASLPRRGPRFTYWLSGIAAVLVIGFFIGKSLWGGPEYQFEDWTPASEDMARGSEQQTIPNLLKMADYAKALDMIETEMKALENEKQHIQSSSMIAEGERDYRLTENQIEMERYWWLKGNALIGLERTKEVLPVLEQLREMESPYYAPLDSLYHVFK